MHQGIFIAIEGSDGSGKETQYKLLAERLKAEGFDVATYDFPQYDSESSYFVKEYLNGNYGSSQAIGPYIPSVFYALDRYSAAKRIAADLAAGKVVLSNRYTGSNMAHQGTKFASSDERRAFFTWVDQLEFGMLDIPRPDLNVVLLVPAKIAQNLVDQKQKRRYTWRKRDLHEADLSHLEKAVEVYQELCSTFKQNFTQIDCTVDGGLMGIPTVNNLIWERVQPMLGKLRKKSHSEPSLTSSHVFSPKEEVDHKNNSNTSYTVPTSLKGNLKKQYAEHIALLLETSAKLNTVLGAEAAAPVLQLLKPVNPGLSEAVGSFEEVAKNSGLQPIKGEDESSVALTGYWPKNELDLISPALYPYSTLSSKQLSQTISDWPYDQKVEQLRKIIDQGSGVAATYQIDLLTSYALFELLSVDLRFDVQDITPFYGYDQLASDSDKDAEDLFEACFDSSMELYKNLQVAGLVQESRGACLYGHRLRWSAQLSFNELKRLLAQLESTDTNEYSQIVHNLIDLINEVHPLVAEKLTGKNSR